MAVKEPKIVKVEDYEKYIGSEAVERIFGKAEKLMDRHVVNVNSTYYGGGVADGVNGFLVSSVEEAAQRMIELVKDRKKRDLMGEKAREKVKKNFLMTRYLENYLDMFKAFETNYKLKM